MSITRLRIGFVGRLDARGSIRVLMLCLVLVLMHGCSSQRPVLNNVMGPPSDFTCFWTDSAPKVSPNRGPATASGVIIWSHGQNYRQPQWQFGVPPIIRAFSEKGWDILMAQRNENCAGAWTNEGEGYVQNMLEVVAKAKKDGYKQVLVAGQSIGAGIAIGASERTPHIDGVMAFALSHGRGECRNPQTFTSDMVPFYGNLMEQSIRASRSQRILVSMGKGDHCVGMSFTPPVERALKAQGGSYIHFDEENMLPSGHGAALTDGFLHLYGGCVLKFFNQIDLPPKGRRVC